MTKFKSRPKFFTDANGRLQSYLYCSCCVSRAYLPHEEGTEIFHVGGDRQKIYYCKRCRSNKSRTMNTDTDENAEADIVKELEPEPIKPKIEMSSVEVSTKYFVIMLLNKKDHYCTQFCENVDQFIKDINEGKKIDGLYYPPFELVYKRAFSNEQLAKQKAHEIKSYTREKKIALVKDQSNEL